jgi:2-oxoglutarate dehydrogenase E1 component
MSPGNFSTTANYNYIADLYKKFCNGDALSDDWQEYFQNLTQEELSTLAQNPSASWQDKSALLSPFKAEQKDKVIPAKNQQGNILQSKAFNLIEAFRNYGHLAVELDPLKLQDNKFPKELDYQTYEITAEEFEQGIYNDKFCNTENLTIKELFKRLVKIYSGRVGIEFCHMENLTEREWLRNRFEQDAGEFQFPKKDKLEIYNGILQVDMLEKYLHTKFPGAKRFSIEGAESTITAIEQIIKTSTNGGIEEAIFGMAHRGRLSVLTKVMGKPYHALFSEFSGGTFIPDSLNLPGDVKYHLGSSSDVEINGKKIHITLTHNPSHLEAVSPVVLGRVRAKQNFFQDAKRQKVMAILLHGDAAFSGQGSVMETLALSNVEAYKVGGTVHVITNNQIGFTTNAQSGRSSRYCTDIAKMISAPILHVNGDDPEAVAYAANIASEYRLKFQKDIFIDIVCYRKFGHNEGDEPMFTQPIMYKKIQQMVPLSKLYGQQLVEKNIITAEQLEKSTQDFKDFLDSEFVKAKDYKPKEADWLRSEWQGFDSSLNEKNSTVKTGVALKTIKKFTAPLTSIPESFNAHSKIKRIYQQRQDMLSGKHELDWGMGETLAYATLLNDGYHVRITGQDVERGTFSHRHASIYDQQNNNKYTPLANLGELQKANFEIHNSILSEFGVLGFEYGYSFSSPKTLVIWEAQFGDFANSAQVIIDQFIVSGKAKWMRMSGLVMLLPHGYEGQGPEHSSARLERFLQLCANDNITVANCTTPASFFHLLRRQMLRKFRKPLVVMTPKSFLRHKLAVSKLEEFSEKFTFKNLLPDVLPMQKAKRIIFCSGKVYYDLLEYREEHKLDNVALIRLEQLYPFPKEEVKKQLQQYNNIQDIVWCQEEHKNMGAWHYIRAHFEKAVAAISLDKQITYIGRKKSASPAAGYVRLHQQELTEFISAAFKL